MDRIANAASLLAAARLCRHPVEVLPVLMRPRDEAEAYWVQTAVHGLIERSRFGERTGYKIGCTTPAMRKYLGIRHPCSGGLFAGTVYMGGTATLKFCDYVAVGAEPEIAVRIGRDLSPADGPFDAKKLADAVDSYFAAIEVVDNRYADWRKTGTPTLIADDFFAAACVLGDPVPAAEIDEVGALTGVFKVNGAEIARGRGRDIMEHPFNALAWLANSLVGRGQTLKAGEVVLLGSLGVTQWLEEGDVATVEIAHLGEVELRVV
jgi:2-oxo-3-hexenedioate decarboxylase/2-keto-4-pentenoate hydratase